MMLEVPDSESVDNGLPRHHLYLSEQQQVISKTGVKAAAGNKRFGLHNNER